MGDASELPRSYAEDSKRPSLLALRRSCGVRGDS
jgi:hypothetical protein